MKTYLPILFLTNFLLPLSAQESKVMSRTSPEMDEIVQALSFTDSNAGSLMLGVSSSPLPTVVREQLGLKQGLVINFVVKDSAANKAGLKAGDILLQVDDQLLFSTDQLSGLLQFLGVGKEVELTYIHKGKQLNSRCVLKQAEGSVTTNGNIEAEMMDILKRAGFPTDITAMTNIDMTQAITKVKVQDTEMTLRMKEGVRNAVIVDSKGVIIFDGPIETEEQRKAVPEAYRESLNLAVKMLPDLGKIIPPR